MIEKPLVSCLCISHNRSAYLKRAIACFLAQTYANKELVIVSNDCNSEYEAIVNNCNHPGIKYYALGNTRKLTLGELRNVGIDRATGEYFCIWDDDDWYHSQRIEIQITEALKSGKHGSILPFCILYDAVRRTASMSRQIVPPASILCKKNVITNQLLYPPMNVAEDTAFLQKLFAKNILYPLINPVLYIYVFHGGNTTNSDLYKKFYGHALPAHVNQLIVDIVENKYSVTEGSALLGSEMVLKELDYFCAYA